MIKNIGKKNSVFNEFVREIRDVDIQRDKMRFRRNLERIGEIFAYEISQTFDYINAEVETSLGTAYVDLINEDIVIASILRAGLPMHLGFLSYFDKAENAFISAYRNYEGDGTFEVNMEYLSSPEIEEKNLILCDPMLATGASMVLAYQSILEKGKPKHTHIVSLIASKEGIEHLEKNLNEQDYTLWVGAIDDELTAQSYIVPGLGDAGDLAFGSKTHE